MTNKSQLLTVKKNLDFGPAWEVVNPNGKAVAAAHLHADAVAYALGQITGEELDRRNKRLEETPDADVPAPSSHINE